jgi:PPE-repeat protein
MGFVDGTRAHCTRSWFLCLPLLAAAVCWVLTTADARAQDVEADSPGGDAFAELIGGTLGVSAGGLVGIGTGFVARQFERCAPGEEFCGVGPALLGIAAGALGMLTLTPAGVSIAGAQTEGRGSYWAALCGAAVGFGGMFAGLATFAPTVENPGVALAGFAVLMVAGAVIGYRVSAPQRVAIAIAPALDGRGATLAFGVRL